MRAPIPEHPILRFRIKRAKRHFKNIEYFCVCAMHDHAATRRQYPQSLQWSSAEFLPQAVALFQGMALALWVVGYSPWTHGRFVLALFWLARRR
jgi:hypothetical protein